MASWACNTTIGVTATALLAIKAGTGPNNCRVSQNIISTASSVASNDGSRYVEISFQRALSCADKLKACAQNVATGRVRCTLLRHRGR